MDKSNSDGEVAGFLVKCYLGHLIFLDPFLDFLFQLALGLFVLEIGKMPKIFESQLTVQVLPFRISDIDGVLSNFDTLGDILAFEGDWLQEGYFTIFVPDLNTMNLFKFLLTHFVQFLQRWADRVSIKFGQKLADIFFLLCCEL